MIGMAGIVVRIAIRGQRKGVLRGWPIVAETWAFVAIPAHVLLTPQAAGIVAGAQALVGDATLGVLLAVAPAAPAGARRARSHRLLVTQELPVDARRQHQVEL
jgi:hypothetical protein